MSLRLLARRLVLKHWLFAGLFAVDSVVATAMHPASGSGGGGGATAAARPRAR